jgi:hypothetical protein
MKFPALPSSTSKAADNGREGVTRMAEDQGVNRGGGCCLPSIRARVRAFARFAVASRRGDRNSVHLFKDYAGTERVSVRVRLWASPHPRELAGSP